MQYHTSSTHLNISVKLLHGRNRNQKGKKKSWIVFKLGTDKWMHGSFQAEAKQARMTCRWNKKNSNWLYWNGILFDLEYQRKITQVKRKVEGAFSLYLYVGSSKERDTILDQKEGILKNSKESKDLVLENNRMLTSFIICLSSSSSSGLCFFNKRILLTGLGKGKRNPDCKMFWTFISFSSFTI